MEEGIAEVQYKESEKEEGPVDDASLSMSPFAIPDNGTRHTGRRNDPVEEG